MALALHVPVVTAVDFASGGNPLDNTEGTVESRVRNFYEQAIPNKVGTLSKIFFRYKEREEQLLADMRNKYGGKTLEEIQKEAQEQEEAQKKKAAAAAESVGEDVDFDDPVEAYDEHDPTEEEYEDPYKVCACVAVCRWSRL